MAKKTNTEIGKKGEQQALDLLIGKGYEILATNYRYKKSEIDVVAKKGEKIIFVEVKFRKSTFFGNPEDFVSNAQAERIHAAADHYTYMRKWNGNIRFDIIAITASKDILHIEDAF